MQTFFFLSTFSLSEVMLGQVSSKSSNINSKGVPYFHDLFLFEQSAHRSNNLNLSPNFEPCLLALTDKRLYSLTRTAMCCFILWNYQTYYSFSIIGCRRGSVSQLDGQPSRLRIGHFQSSLGSCSGHQHAEQSDGKTFDFRNCYSCNYFKL